MRRIWCYLLLFSLCSCGLFKPAISTPKREFRGVWIATVANIDWPKDPNASWEVQKQEFRELLEFYKDLNFNAVIVQVRTAGDAFYPTKKAPWSRYLTGTEGEPPGADEDPLSWMIATSHQYGMEFHAWLNPYRATMSLDTTILSDAHDLKTHPEWMLPYGTKYYYDPGLPEVQDKLTEIMEEVVLNYPVDALHFDDYFYPYKIQGEQLQDSLTFKKYALPGQSLADWRRSNVDSLVKKIHTAIKKHKPWVQFGISPFGVWKNKDTDPEGSDTNAGQTTYEDLYADPLLWMEKGWIDYLIPQVYWSMEYEPASHRKIVNWWSDHKDISNIYIGNGAYKVRNNPDPAWDDTAELERQLTHARSTPGISGNTFFSAKSLVQAPTEVLKSLRKKLYKWPALSPVSPLAPPYPAVTPQLVEVIAAPGEFIFRVDPSASDFFSYALVYKGRKKKQELPVNTKDLIAKIPLTADNDFRISQSELKGNKKILVTFLDPYGKESQPIFLHLNQTKPHDQKR